jgi:hypothetical protein
MQQLQRKSSSSRTSDRLEILFRCSTHWLAHRTPLLKPCSNSPAKTNVESFDRTNFAMRWGLSNPSSYFPISRRQLVKSFRRFSQQKADYHNANSLTERASRHGQSGTTAIDSRHSISSVSTRTGIVWRCRFRQPPNATTLLFRRSLRRVRRYSTRPMHCSRQFFHPIATAILMIHLGKRCFGHRIHHDYSSIRLSAHGCSYSIR